jgi:ABC-2 type transport system ATP-binding protein
MTRRARSACSVCGCICGSVSSLTARDVALASVDTVELEQDTDLASAPRHPTGKAATIAANVLASGVMSRDASRGDPTLVASGLTKLFGSREVVSDLSFQASTGRAFGLLGPNGSGKTTTVRLLTGLLVPSRGSVTLFGETLSRSNADALRGRIGVQTDTNLYEALSVRDNLRTWGELHGLPSRAVRRRVDEVLHVLDLSDRADSLVGELSKGMRQKLSVGRAVLHEPELLFLDEPTAGLDPEASADLIDYLKQMIRTLHTTVIICTHQLQGLESLCDDIAILKNGRLVVAGEVRQLLHQRWPQRRYLLAVDGDLASARRIVTSLTARSSDVAATDGSLRLCVPNEESISSIVAALVRNQIRIRAVIPQQPTIQDLYFATINDGKQPE